MQGISLHIETYPASFRSSRAIASEEYLLGTEFILSCQLYSILEAADTQKVSNPADPSW